MEHTVGEHVVHPAHGTGEIVDIEQHELVEGFSQYYVIRFADKRMTVRVPFQRAEDMGLRGVMSKKKFQQVMKTLRQLPKQLPQDFKERRKRVEDALFSGYPLKVAEVVRELSWRAEARDISTTDRRLLQEARTMLVQEMSASSETEPDTVENAVNQALLQGFEAKNAEIAEVAAVAAVAAVPAVAAAD